MSEEQYRKFVQTFGAEAAKNYKAIEVVKGPVKPLTVVEMLANVKAGSARTKLAAQQPSGFYTDQAGKAFQDALFHRSGQNGHKGMPVMAISFAQLRQAQIEGELADQFTMLSQNILTSPEFDSAAKAEKLSALASEYASLTRGQKGKR